MFADNVKELLRINGKTQKELAEYLGVKQNTVSDWVNQGNSPKLHQLCRMSDFFSISLDRLITGDEWPKGVRLAHTLPETPENSRILNGLDDIEKGLVLERIQSFIDLRKAKEAVAAPPLAVVPPIAPPAPAAAPAVPDDDEEDDEEDGEINMPIYNDAAAAGLGYDVSVDDSPCQMQPFRAGEVPAAADLGIYIVGDSMEPDVHDGDLAWVQSGTVDPWELGIFVLGDKAYCKRPSWEDGDFFLVSLNKEYEPILVEDPDDLRTVGKVIGIRPGHFSSPKG